MWWYIVLLAVCLVLALFASYCLGYSVGWRDRNYPPVRHARVESRPQPRELVGPLYESINTDTLPTIPSVNERKRRNG